MKKIAIYARVQDNPEVYADIDEQIAFCKKHAPVPPDEILVYREFGSANYPLEERPALNRLFCDVNAGSISCILVTDMARLSRNLATAADYVGYIMRAGGRLIICSESGGKSTLEFAGESQNMVSPVVK